MMDSLERLDGCLSRSSSSVDLLEFEVEQEEESHVMYPHEYGSIVRFFLRAVPKGNHAHVLVNSAGVCGAIKASKIAETTMNDFTCMFTQTLTPNTVPRR